MGSDCEPKCNAAEAFVCVYAPLACALYRQAITGLRVCVYAYTSMRVCVYIYCIYIYTQICVCVCVYACMRVCATRVRTFSARKKRVLIQHPFLILLSVSLLFILSTRTQYSLTNADTTTLGKKGGGEHVDTDSPRHPYPTQNHTVQCAHEPTAPTYQQPPPSSWHWRHWRRQTALVDPKPKLKRPKTKLKN